jgi:hypothetical protein
MGRIAKSQVTAARSPKRRSAPAGSAAIERATVEPKRVDRRQASTASAPRPVQPRVRDGLVLRKLGGKKSRSRKPSHADVD